MRSEMSLSRRRDTRRPFIMALAATCLVFLFASLAQAATFHVTTTADNGDNTNPTPGSLRKAIIDANNNPGLDTIDFNISGAGVQTINPPTVLPTVTDPVVIDGYTQPGASPNTLTNGDNAVLLIELNGTNTPAGISGLSISAGGSTVRGLVINRFSNVDPQTSGAVGISLTSKGGNIISGNFIGTDASGTVKAGNYYGIIVDGCGNNTIGGTTPAARNIISGSVYRGLLIRFPNAVNNLVQGNFIGTDSSGKNAIRNQYGVAVEGIPFANSNNVIGGTTPGAGNVISGNNTDGITLSFNVQGVSIQGNLIGTDVTGKVALSNNVGVHAAGVNGATIGGTTAAARNVISGNGEAGITIDLSSNNVVIQGNYIGTDLSGTAPLGNLYAGVFSVVSNVTVGGTTAGAGNVISNNGSYGFLMGGNATSGDTVEGNSISNNGVLGIDLAPLGVTPNDAGDADTGANGLQNYPVVTSAVLNAGTTTITGTLNSTANTQFRVEFFSNTTCNPSTYGEGQTFLGATNVTTNGNGDANVNQTFGGLSAGQFITTTATDPAGNTSEFSQCRQITTPGATVSLQFNAASYSVNEQGGQATITVTRTGGNVGAVSVQYSTVDGTATAGQDYTAASGTLNWADGDASSKTFVIPISDDSLDEDDETVNLTLSNPTGGAVLGGQSSATLTIVDDDPTPTVSINDVTQAEGDSGTTNFNFTVSLSTPSGRIVSVDYQTADGTAHAGTDYIAASGTLLIAPGNPSRQITIKVNGNTKFEPDKTFFLNISNPVALTITKAQGTGTIVNDDAAPLPTVQFDSASYTVSEGAHFKQITVTRTGDTSQPASVDYATSDGTAHQQSDYTIALGTLSFAAGEASKTLTLLVTDDSYVEGDETFTISLSNPVGVALGGQAVAQVTITDNDTNPAAPNAIDDVQNFIRQHYHDFLNREPDPQGFAGWQNILNNCPQSDKDSNGNFCDRIEVSSDFYRSPEFHDRGYFIYRFYSASLGRIPKYLEFMRDMQQVSGFLSPQEEEAAKQKFIADFMTRNEFQQKYASITDAGQFVDAILSTAGVTSQQRDQIVAQLQSNQITRGEALRAVIETAEVDQKFFNEAFVIMQYFGYLRRDADILYLNWLATLNQTKDYRVMVNGFLNSLEYRQRFGQ